MNIKAIKLLFILAIVFGLSTHQSEAQERANEFYLVVDEMPEYPGGINALEQYVSSIVKFPQEALTKQIAGKVYVLFTVNKEGKMTGARIARGIDPTVDKEALRVVNEVEKTWKPGIDNDKKVDVVITVLFTFKEDGTVDFQVLPNRKKDEKE